MKRPVHQKRAQAPKRYDDVEFEFINSDSHDSQTGSVLVGDTRMVIDIPEPAEFQPCCIEGQLTGLIFSGRNTLRHENPRQIQARWVDLGDRFVGVWIEEGIEYLFSFRLPRRRTS